MQNRGRRIANAYFSLTKLSLTIFDIAGVGNNEIVHMYLVGITPSFQIKSIALKRTPACYVYT